MGDRIRPVWNDDRPMDWDDPVKPFERKVSDVMRDIGVEGIRRCSRKKTGEYIVRWSIFRLLSLAFSDIERVVAVWLRSPERQLAGERMRENSQTRERSVNITPKDGDERIKDLHHAFRRFASSAQSILFFDGAIEDCIPTVGGRPKKGTSSKTIVGTWDSLDRSSSTPLPFHRRLVSTTSPAISSLGP